MTAELSGDLEDPAFRAELGFRNMVYGAHPLARDPRGGARDIARLTRADAIEHHRRHFVPDNTVLVAVGDFDPRRLASWVKARFGAWPASGVPCLHCRKSRSRDAPACAVSLMPANRSTSSWATSGSLAAILISMP